MKRNGLLTDIDLGESSRARRSASSCGLCLRLHVDRGTGVGPGTRAGRQGTGSDAWADPRGVRGAGGQRSQVGTGRSQAAPRDRSRRCPRTRSRPARTCSGFPGTGAGTRNATTSSGSAESGASLHRAGSGCPDTGTRLTGDFSGCPATGCLSALPRTVAMARLRRPRNPLTCPLRRKAWRPGRTARRPRKGCSGRPEAGTGKGTATSGGRASGPPRSQAGSGSRRTTSGRPGGYLFVEGYWDLPLASRGLLFAPVYYPQPVYLQPAYVFTPSITIATPGLVANLFVQPAYGHYCFGDYYDRSFLSVGIYPWFSFSYVSGPARPVFYDPIFTYYASVNVRRDPGWVTRVRREYVVRRDNVAMRPPRTFVEQTRIIERHGPNRDVVIARSIRTARQPSRSRGGNASRTDQCGVAAAMARPRCGTC